MDYVFIDDAFSYRFLILVYKIENYKFSPKNFELNTVNNRVTTSNKQK